MSRLSKILELQNAIIALGYVPLAPGLWNSADDELDYLAALREQAIDCGIGITGTDETADRVPDSELTPRQRMALARLWHRNPVGTYREFRNSVRRGPGCIMVPWCGMWIGIEEDGYTHS